MGVMRLGYVHIRNEDLAGAKDHYEGTLGMHAVEESPDTVYFKAWDEYDHHSVVVERGGSGLVRLGYKCESDSDLEEIENRVKAFGAFNHRISKGENHAVGEGLRVLLPSGHTLDLYSEMEYHGTETGVLNPDPAPRDPRGASVPRLDHALVTCEDPELAERFFTECLGFGIAERVITDPSSAQLIATFMFCTNTPHDIAFIKGEDAKLHHFAFLMEDWNSILRAGDVFAMDDTPVEVGPTRHGITRGTTIYFYDRSGNRNEVFSGGYLTYPDFPTITWTADQLARGIFYIAREMNERFTTVVT